MMKRTNLIVLGCALLLLMGAGCVSDREDDDAVEGNSVMNDTSPIKIGWVGPITGDLSSLGTDAKVSAEIAVEEVNAAGGVNGRMLELIAEDGRCTPKDAANAGTKLINVDQVPVIIGGLCSGETTAVAPMAEQNKVVLISSCSSAPNITDAGDYIFRTYPSDVYQGKYAAEYAYNTLGKKKVAVLAVLGDYGTGIKNAFIKNFEQLGGTIVSAEDFTQETRDLRTALTKVKNGDAELLYFIAQTEASNVGLRQAKELGITIPMLGGDTWDDTNIHKNSFAEGIEYTVAAVGAKGEKGDEWVNKMTAKGASNTVCAPGAYNNVHIIADIMKRVGTDTTKIKDELYKVKDYEGVNGKITLDQNGDLATAEYEVKTVKKGKSEVVK